MTDTDQHILIVDDQISVRNYLRTILGVEGFTIFEAASGQQAISAVASQQPDIIILDLDLPDFDGIEVTRRLREWSQTPIIILSVREAENDKIAAINAGADDYITKPFSSGELITRIRVALRRQTSTSHNSVFQVDHLKLDTSRHLVMLDEKAIALTPAEYEILRLLMQSAGKVLTNHQLVQQIWGAAYESKIYILRINISNLRRKIEPDPFQPHYILTESGVGYRIRT